MEVCRSEVPAERARWLALWEEWPAREVFAHPAYLDAFAAWSGGEACAAIDESEAGCVLYPFFIRSIAGTEACDLSSPYGYGGPHCWAVADRVQLETDFWAGFDSWCTTRGVVSEFVRLALEPADQLAYPGDIEQRAQNIVRSLELDEETLWSNVKHKVRKNVKRARQDGLSVEVDPVGERLDEFLSIYHATMDRRDADQSYCFDRDFFERLESGAPGSVLYFHAVVDGSVVASELVLVSADSLYSFLGGTDPAFFASRPNDLLKYEVCLWGMREGNSRFVLGGGKSPDDGIFRYKQAFAPDGAVPFRTGQRVIDADAYRHLVESAGVGDTKGFFPAYRAA